MRRGFVAVVPPEAVLDALAARVAALAELAGVRWSARDQWHLTVQFLGDADLDAVVGALDGLPGPATSVRLGGAGAFPRPERARVAWVGLCEGGDDLGALATEVATRTAGPGHAPAVPRARHHRARSRTPRRPTPRRGARRRTRRSGLDRGRARRVREPHRSGPGSLHRPRPHPPHLVTGVDR